MSRICNDCGAYHGIENSFVKILKIGGKIHRNLENII